MYNTKKTPKIFKLKNENKTLAALWYTLIKIEIVILIIKLQDLSVSVCLYRRISLTDELIYIVFPKPLVKGSKS